MRTTVTSDPHTSHRPLCSACISKECRLQVGVGEPSEKMCEIVEARAGFQPGIMLRNEQR